MATQLYARVTETHFHPFTYPYETDLLTASGTVENAVPFLRNTTVNGERAFVRPNQTLPLALWSGRLVGAVTLSGDVTFQVNAKQTLIGSDPELRLRARLWKVTAGGADVETLVTEADATAGLTGSYALYTFTGIIVTPVDCVENERLVMRVYAFPFTGDFNAADPAGRLRYCDSGGAGANPTGVTLTETLTFKPNGTEIFQRTTATIGIGNFWDLSLMRGSSAATTETVPTTAGGTEIVFTRETVPEVPPGTIAVTEITAAAITSTSNVATYASASFAPVADRLYLLAVVHSDTAPEADVPTIATTTGLNFVQAGSSKPFNSIADNLNRLTLFRAMKPSGLSAGTYTVTFANNSTGCAALLAEVTGIVITGTDGANAISNISTNSADASVNPSVTLGAFAQTYHGTFACFGSSLQTAPTNGSGFTSLSHPDYATPATGLYAEWLATSDTSADCVLASSAWAGIAVELIAVPPVPAVDVTLEWIGPRFKAGWDAYAAKFGPGAYTYMTESDVLANCQASLKVFRRQPTGTETLVSTMLFAGELPTSLSAAIPNDLPPTTTTPTVFAEDDRLVVRAYVINRGTMAAGYTCDIVFDSNVDLGNARLVLYGLPEFKAEGDPAKTSHVVGGQTMFGVGN